MTRVRVIYESMFGNTAAVAGAVVEGLRAAPDVEVELHEVGDAPATTDGVDLLVIGAPTHAFSLPKPPTREDAARRRPEPLVSSGPGIREWLDGLERTESPPAVATFDTRVKVRWLPGSAAKAAKRRLARKGLRAVDVTSFWVTDVLGPLRDGELDRARRWGGALVERVRGHRPAA